MTSNKLNIFSIVAVAGISAGLIAGCQQSSEAGSTEQEYMNTRGDGLPKGYNGDDSGKITALRPTSIVYTYLPSSPPDAKIETVTCPIAAGTTIRFKELVRSISTGDDKRVFNKATQKTEWVAPVVALSNGLIIVLGAKVQTISDEPVDTSDPSCNFKNKEVEAEIHPNFFSGFNDYQKVYNMPGRLKKLPKDEIP
jgi:hypothetical protein